MIAVPVEDARIQTWQFSVAGQDFSHTDTRRYIQACSVLLYNGKKKKGKFLSLYGNK